MTYSFSDAYGCSNSTTASVRINALPTATISYPGSPYCATGTATVSRTGQIGGTYSAAAGLNINPSTGAINLASSTPGDYTVTYTFSNGICPNTTTANVTVLALPTATISYPGSPYCATGTAAVTQTGQGGGLFSSTPGLIIDPPTGIIDLAADYSGLYTVTYSFSDPYGCSNSTTASVRINALPTATISYPGSPYCATGTATVSRTGQIGGTYSAAAGLNINPSTGAINLASSTPGDYTVTYTFSNGICPNTTTANVTISPLPTATISYAGSPYCTSHTLPQAVIITGTGPYTGGDYSASPSGLNIDALTGDITGSSTTGTYTVTYTIPSSGGCNEIPVTTIVTITPLPTASISYAGAPFCTSVNTPQNVTLTGTGNYTNGTFTSSPTGLTINSSTGAITPSVSTPRTYTVTYPIPASGGCAAVTASTTVTITALPAATISYIGTPFCTSLSSPQTVILTGTGAYMGGTFTASPVGLTIDAVTGSVPPVPVLQGHILLLIQFLLQEVVQLMRYRQH